MYLCLLTFLVLNYVGTFDRRRQQRHIHGFVFVSCTFPRNEENLSPYSSIESFTHSCLFYIYYVQLLIIQMFISSEILTFCTLMLLKQLLDFTLAHFQKNK